MYLCYFQKTQPLGKVISRLTCLSFNQLSHVIKASALLSPVNKVVQWWDNSCALSSDRSHGEQYIALPLYLLSELAEIRNSSFKRKDETVADQNQTPSL